MEDSKVIEDISDPKDSMKSLTKVPPPSALESQLGHLPKTRLDALNAKNLDTCRRIAQNSPEKFEDYNYTYSVPNIQPQMQINSADTNMATTYDQVLGAINDSTNIANPLASLNL